MTRRTKIVATVGPASSSRETLRRMIEAGLDVVRLNLSHGTVDEHVEHVADVRAAAEQAGRHVAILADLPGPKLRSGAFPEDGSYLAPTSTVRLVVGDGGSDANTIAVPYPSLLADVEPGMRVLLGDGAICLLVSEVGPDHVEATVATGGRMRGSPGVHIPAESFRLTTPTDEDLVLAETMAATGVEYIAVSFVRRAADVEQVRAIVRGRSALVAKIETTGAIKNLDHIMNASDAIMVARGDLGIDCPLEDVPHLQKQIIRECVRGGVPVITATQMLESMITAPSPTRAEVSDVANAVFDGTDALMLSGETAIGVDPVGVIETMSRVAERAEHEAGYRAWANRLGREQQVDVAGLGERITMALTRAASQAAIDGGVSAILCCTRSGRTVRAMARFRPDAALLGLAPDPTVVRRMALVWGVQPVVVELYETTDDMVWFAIETALSEGHVADGDTVLVLAGAPDLGRVGSVDERPATDVLRIVKVD